MIFSIKLLDLLLLLLLLLLLFAVVVSSDSMRHNVGSSSSTFEPLKSVDGRTCCRTKIEFGACFGVRTRRVCLARSRV